MALEWSNGRYWFAAPPFIILIVLIILIILIIIIIIIMFVNILTLIDYYGAFRAR